MPVFVTLFAVLIFVVALAMFGCLLNTAVKSFAASIEAGRLQSATLAYEISKARAAFSPTQVVPCKSCSGTGRKVRDNPLVTAIAKAIDDAIND